MRSRQAVQVIGTLAIGFALGWVMRPQPQPRLRFDVGDKIVLVNSVGEHIHLAKTLAPYAVNMDGRTPSVSFPPSKDVWYIQLADGRVRIVATEVPSPFDLTAVDAAIAGKK